MKNAVPGPTGGRSPRALRPVAADRRQEGGGASGRGLLSHDRMSQGADPLDVGDDSVARLQELLLAAVRCSHARVARCAGVDDIAREEGDA